MKNLYYVVVVTGVCFILLTACSKPVFYSDQYILIEKRVGEEEKYEEFKKVTAQRKVEKVRAIIHNARWEKAKVERERPPDYLFIFQFKDPDVEAKAMLYELWVSPAGDQIELVRNNEYAQLDQGVSAEMMEILIDENK